MGDEPRPKVTRRRKLVHITCDDSTRAILERAAAEAPGARSLSGAVAIMAAEWEARNPPKGG